MGRLFIKDWRNIYVKILVGRYWIFVEGCVLYCFLFVKVDKCEVFNLLSVVFCMLSGNVRLLRDRIEVNFLVLIFFWVIFYYFVDLVYRDLLLRGYLRSLIL